MKLQIIVRIAIVKEFYGQNVVDFSKASDRIHEYNIHLVKTQIARKEVLTRKTNQASQLSL